MSRSVVFEFQAAGGHALMRVLSMSIALAVVGAAGAYLWASRQPEPLRDVSTEPVGAAAQAADEPVEPMAPRRAVAAATIAELDATSETFRNTTFVIAIRGAGFYCDDLAHVYAGASGSGTWRVTCRDMRAYSVHVTEEGVLAIEPVLSYFDAPVLPLPNVPELQR